jgi:SAM-dependent methyltransferase
MTGEDAVLGWVFRAFRRRARGLETPPPTTQGMREALTDEVADVDGAVAQLSAAGDLVPEGDGWWLAGGAVDRARAAERAVSAEAFGKWMVAAAASPAYARFCAHANQLPFVVFDMLDPVQLDAALAAAALTPGQGAIDLGCGVGTLSRHVARTTGATVSGVDLAPRAIDQARALAADGSSFEVCALDEWMPAPGAYDVVFSFDTAYFAEDLPGLLTRCAAGLAPGGRVVALYSATGGGPETRTPEGSRFAVALRAAGLSFTTVEYTDRELAVWRRSQEAVVALEAAFTEEGTRHLWDGRRRETDAVLPTCEAGGSRRYLYVARRASEAT